MLTLQDALGEPFKGGVPEMRQAQLTSDAEYLKVLYGWRALIVEQRWTKTPVRVEQVAPQAWEHVSKALDVARSVVRCGFRLQFLWAVPTVDEGHELIRRTGLVASTPRWNEFFGSPKLQAYTGTFTDHRGATTRTNVDVVEMKVEGNVTEELKGRVPECAIQLDIDTTYPAEKERFSLGVGQLRDFLRESASRNRKLAERITVELEEAKGHA